MNAQIKKISHADIDASLTDVTRQYLVGNLKLPQKLKHIPSGQIEVGITRYVEAGTEAPHCHTQAFEYQYMISGYTVYLDVKTDEKHHFKKRDFYVIEPGVTYAQKSKSGTEILFFKVPPGNDKISVPETDEIRAWLEPDFDTFAVNS